MWRLPPEAAAPFDSNSGSSALGPALLALAAATFGAALSLHASHLNVSSDLDQLLAAARYLWAGKDPYQHVGPGLSYPWPWPLYYPLSAVVLVLPLAGLDATTARAVFMALSCALLGAAIVRTGLYRLPLFVSGAFVNAVVRTQWSPLLVAAALTPALGFVYAAKPNLGAALWAARPSRVAALGACAMLACSFAFDLSWPVHWWHAVQAAPHMRPAILYPWGWLIALAAFRWRRPEARLLLLLAFVPQTLAEYAVLPLFLVTRNFSEAAVLALGSCAVTYYLHFLSPSASDAAYIAASGHSVTLACFLPCLVMVLARRNVGRVPSRVENALDDVLRRKRSSQSGK